MEVLIKYCINSFLKLINLLKKIYQLPSKFSISLLFVCDWSIHSEGKYNWLTGTG